MIKIELLLIALILAFFLDIAFGEPVRILHPVVWMGKIIEKLADAGRKIRRKERKKIYGFFILFLCLFLAGGLGYILQSYLGSSLEVFSILILAYLIKSCFSFNLLIRSSHSAYQSIKRDLDEGREKVGKLVSRDVERLNERELISAVIESTSENFVDGFLSPLFYLALFGLPGILGFKIVSTLDSMIGYRNERWNEIGFASAKMDDVLNFIPSRLSILIISISSLQMDLKTVFIESRKVESPNSGYPMASVSSALKVKLTKPAHYVIGERFRDVEAEDIIKTENIIIRSCILSAILIILCLYFTGLPLI